jgi:hypothetical protein
MRGHGIGAQSGRIEGAALDGTKPRLGKGGAGGVEDGAFNGLGKGSGLAIIDHGIDGFVAAFAKDADIGDVTHDVVAVTGDDETSAAEFFLRSRP